MYMNDGNKYFWLFSDDYQIPLNPDWKDVAQIVEK